MSMDEKVIADLAAQFIAAEDQHAPLEPISARYPDLSAEDAYRVQQALIERRVRRGEKVVGKKIGATNEAVQRKFGLTSPLYGYLFASQQVPSGGTIALAQLIQPRLECEVAFRLKQDLAGPGITAVEVLAATQAVMASFEIPDARTRDWNLGMREFIADNGASARFVLGERQLPVPAVDLANLTVVLKRNGEQIAEASSAAVMGNPANAVAWLANKLTEHGSRLHAGEIVMSGTVTPLFPIAAGDTFEALFDQLGSVSVEFV